MCYRVDRSRGNEMIGNHTASILAITVLFQGTDNIKLNKTTEPSANSSKLAWAWGQTRGDPGSFWRQVPCGSVHMATAVPQTVGSSLSLHISFWFGARQAFAGFNRHKTCGIRNTTPFSAAHCSYRTYTIIALQGPNYLLIK